MRLTGGHLRGRVLQTPKNSAVRPASDKVRQAVFNTLNSRIDLEGMIILDGFCGTGSYGLEALSRGAAHGYFIDKHRASLALCRQNAKQLGVDTRCLFYQKDLGKDLKFPETSSLDPADLLFLDPPYGQDLLMPAFLNLQKNGWLAKGCICVFECERELHIPETESRYYGDTQIIIRELE